ncbi:ATP-binding protein [Arthrobacter alkaliphilus]|uniref:AAA family ATPase n=1 Tax=Arthrobacter alkaliphilus TaxID=369936 RepID=UPI001F1FB963|nr:AAA family ATPase [Arthrobacter alkaliphilus]
MNGIIVVTGPPGSGKSTVAGLLADSFETSAVVEGDRFFGFLRQGYIPPWLPEAHAQNTAVIEAAAQAAGRLARHSDVVYDGVVGPWFIKTFLAHTGLEEVHYVILLPPLAVCLERVKTRTHHGFTDIDAAEHMWRDFDQSIIEDRHRFISPGADPEETASQIAALASNGRFTYRSSP